VGCFSFQASKNVTGGEGGMIVTNDEGWADKCWSVVNVGRVRQGAWYQHVGLASNYRLSEWAAAVLRVQLSRIEEQSVLRERNAIYLAEALSEVDGLVPGRTDHRVTRNVYHLFKLWYQPERVGEHSAGEFAAAMRAEGIPMTVGYPIPLNRQQVVVEHSADIRKRLGLPAEEPVDCLVCEEVCTRGLWLHQSVFLGTKADMDDIVTAAKKIVAAWR
jgi:dTDP-4-amino-4,6-dideoxygalactose transaminase